MRQAVAFILTQFKPDKIEPQKHRGLIELLARDGIDAVAIEALKAYENWNLVDERTFNFLTELSFKTYRNREELLAKSKVEREELLKLFKTILEKSPFEEVRLATAWALGELGRKETAGIPPGLKYSE